MKVRGVLKAFCGIAMVTTLVACGSAGRGNRVIVIREANPADAGLQDLAAERARIADETKLGRGETKSWKDRYQGYNPERPYQGDPMHYNRVTLPKGSL